MNYKRSFIGVVVMVCGGLSGCDEKKDKVQMPLLNNHDEPVIIENGSVKIDFNRGNGADAVGYLTEDGHAFVRGNAPSVKKIRVFAAEENRPFQQVKCKDKNSNTVECEEKLIAPKSLTVGMSGGGMLQLHWSKKGKDGMVMVSPTQTFQSDPNLEFQIVAEKDAQQNPVTLEKVSFYFDTVPQEFSRPNKGRLVVQVCVKDDAGHCTNYQP